jgi:exodeoxyribonuclease VII small subunit
MTDPTCPAPEEQSFGEALAELDSIVAALEGGQLELEESMTRYERGVALLKALKAKLDDAEQKVTMLVGELEEEAADASDAPSAAPTSPAGGAGLGQEVPF